MLADFHQNAHLHTTKKLFVLLLKKIVSEVAYSDNLKTNKSSCCEHTMCIYTWGKNISIFDMFLFWKVPIAFLIKINFDKRTAIERQVLTNKTDAIKVLLENYLNNLCQNPFLGWFSFSWYAINVLVVSVRRCSAINCNCCAWSICLSFSLICDFK